MEIVCQTANECTYKPPREGETWCFYFSNMLKFETGSAPTFSTIAPTLTIGKGCASISDQNGNLVMYTDGMFFWDKTMAKANTTFEGNPGSTTPAIIVPNPSNNGIYYVFTTDIPYDFPPYLYSKGLNYTTVNTRSTWLLDTLPKKQILQYCTEKLTGTRHANGYDYWVVAHGWENNNFLSIRVTSAGVDSNYVTSSSGMVHQGTQAERNSVGCMKMSPDGSRLAAAIYGSKLIEVFDFNNASGKVSNPRPISSPDGGWTYGVEFSPDNRYLYFTSILNQSSNANNNLYQVDLNSNSPPFLINSLPLNATALQLGIDGKIYALRYKENYLGVIENPNRPDTACNYKDQGFQLGSNISYNGLPAFIQSYFNIPGVIYDTKCDGDDTYFYITNQANIDSVKWDFGDPASAASNTDTQLQPFHVFSASGDYNVLLTEYFSNRSFNTSFNVHIDPLPDKCFTTGDSIPMLPGSEVPLSSLPYMNLYQWSTGETVQSIQVKQPGLYNVMYIDTNCCMQRDTIKIYLLDLVVPNAFSPNHDGKNDRFHVKGPTLGIANYHFYIYNRWGQLIWETDNFDDGWDGTLNGSECPMGVYSWVMKFSVTGNLLNRDKVIKRGVLTLVK